MCTGVSRVVLRLGASGCTRVGDLWAYLTEHWLRLIYPRPGARIERCPTDPAWRDLSRGVFLDSRGREEVVELKRDADLERILDGLLGGMTSFGAVAGVYEMDSVLHFVRSELRARMARRGTDFPDLVGRKADRQARVDATAKRRHRASARAS